MLADTSEEDLQLIACSYNIGRIELRPLIGRKVVMNRGKFMFLLLLSKDQ